MIYPVYFISEKNAKIQTIMTKFFSQCIMSKDYYIYLSNLGAQRAGTSVIVIVIRLCNDEYLKKVSKEKCFCIRSIGSMCVFVGYYSDCSLRFILLENIERSWQHWSLMKEMKDTLSVPKSN